MVYDINIGVTQSYTINGCGFDNLSMGVVNEMFKDGRVFSHFMELWISKNFNLKHVKGCKDHDLVDYNDDQIKYEVKTFTKGGCHFCPSNMLGQGRQFDNNIFKEKTKKLIFCIVLNIDFPNIKIKFIKGQDLLELYPNGKIPSQNVVKFFD